MIRHAGRAQESRVVARVGLGMAGVANGGGHHMRCRFAHRCDPIVASRACAWRAAVGVGRTEERRVSGRVALRVAQIAGGCGHDVSSWLTQRRDAIMARRTGARRTAVNIRRIEEIRVIGCITLRVAGVTGGRSGDMAGQFALGDDSVVAGRAGAGWAAVSISRAEECRVIGSVGVACITGCQGGNVIRRHALRLHTVVAGRTHTGWCDVGESTEEGRVVGRVTLGMASVARCCGD